LRQGGQAPKNPKQEKNLWALTSDITKNPKEEKTFHPQPRFNQGPYQNKK